MAVGKILLSIGMIVIIGLLLYLAIKPSEVVVTQPVPTPIIVKPVQPQTPKAQPIVPKVTPPQIEEPALPPGPSMEEIYPSETNFWVNTIRVPATTTYDEGYNFIPVKQDDIKTFAGSFGPYFDDPSQHITVILCAELSKVQAAPACQRVQTIYRDNYLSFAVGFQFDEYIGGMAAKDYIAYYVVSVGNEVIARSNTAVIRTVRD